jgi:alpha-beta hydrolase superfamily lysophospholipase
MPDRSLPPIRRWDRVPDPIGAVHVIHGLAEHPERYADFAAALNAAGLIVWAHHHRGHGSNPTPGIRGHFADEHGWRALIDDAAAVSAAMRQRWPGLPLFLFGHSMGSFVAQGLLATTRDLHRAVVFSGTNGPVNPSERALRHLARAQDAVLGPRKPGWWLHRIVFGAYNARYGVGAPPNTWLSADAREVEAYNHDPLCGFPLTSRAWLDLLSARVVQSEADFLRGIPRDFPIHIVAGTDDAVGENGTGVRRLLQALADTGHTGVTSAFYDKCRHELLHDHHKTRVTADVLRWLAPFTRTST